MDRVSTDPVTVPVRPVHGISKDARRHNEIRKQVLDRHPELAQLAGPDWRTALAATALLGIHWTTIWLVSGTNVFVVFVVALCFGQFVYHSATTLVHESAHRLVFRDKRGKLAFDLLIEAIITSFSRQLIYQHNHISSHHPHLGEYDGDYEHEDICRVISRRVYRAENPRRQHWLTAAQLFLHLLPYGFLTEQLVMPRFFASRTGLVPADPVRDNGATQPTLGERRLFALFSLGIYVFVFVTFGFLGWLYLVWAMSLSIGRCGIATIGQFLSEHPGDDTEYPTRSTYGWANNLFFNTGYHFEHHTFPNIPWMKLPKLTKTAPDAFNVANNRGYFRFWWDHIKQDFDFPIRRSAAHVGDKADRCNLEAA